MKELRFRPSLRALSFRICRPSGVMRMVRLVLFVLLIGLVLAQYDIELAPSLGRPCGVVEGAIGPSSESCRWRIGAEHVCRDLPAAIGLLLPDFDVLALDWCVIDNALKGSNRVPNVP